MGKASKFFKALSCFKSPEPNHPPPSSSDLNKRRWSFITFKSHGVKPHHHLTKITHSSLFHPRDHHPSDRTGGTTGYGLHKKWAAVKIQSYIRAYLARKALRALKALVKMQALVRGHIQRKQVAACCLRRHQAHARRFQTTDSADSTTKITSPVHQPMDSVYRSIVTPSKSRLARTLANLLHIQATTTLNDVHKLKLLENQLGNYRFHAEDEKLQDKATMDAFIAKVFATLSSVEAECAQLQYAQATYDAEGIQTADQIVVSELKSLSEVKQSFLKNHIDDTSPETTILLDETQELKDLSKTFGITGKKLECQSRLKDSKIIFLKEKLEEAERADGRLNSSGPLSDDKNLHFSALTPGDFLSALKHAMISVRSLVKFMITEMEYANWDLNAAARSIQPNVVYWNTAHRCYAIESFVCREIFDGCSHRKFSISSDDRCKHRQCFLDMFMELKYLKAREYINRKPTSTFAKFCWFKYLSLVHPKMESSFFGNLNQRSLVSCGKFPETTFFEVFAEAAKRVWLLHCLAFSYRPDGASMFQVMNGSGYSELFMESINEEALLSAESSREVAFTVVRGFKLGKTVVRCQVYLS